MQQEDLSKYLDDISLKIADLSAKQQTLHQVFRTYPLLLMPSIRWKLIQIYHPPHQGVLWTL